MIGTTDADVAALKIILRNVVARLVLDASANRQDVRAMLDQMRDECRSAARNEPGRLTSIDLPRASGLPITNAGRCDCALQATGLAMPAKPPW